MHLNWSREQCNEDYITAAAWVQSSPHSGYGQCWECPIIWAFFWMRQQGRQSHCQGSTALKLQYSLGAVLPRPSWGLTHPPWGGPLVGNLNFTEVPSEASVKVVQGASMCISSTPVLEFLLENPFCYCQWKMAKEKSNAVFLGSFCNVQFAMLSETLSLCGSGAEEILLLYQKPFWRIIFSG